MPEGHAVTLPRERRAATTYACANVAKTLRATFIVTVHGAVPIARAGTITSSAARRELPRVSMKLGPTDRVSSGRRTVTISDVASDDELPSFSSDLAALHLGGRKGADRSRNHPLPIIQSRIL